MELPATLQSELYLTIHTPHWCSMVRFCISMVPLHAAAQFMTGSVLLQQKRTQKIKCVNIITSHRHVLPEALD